MLLPAPSEEDARSSPNTAHRTRPLVYVAHPGFRELLATGKPEAMAPVEVSVEEAERLRMAIQASHIEAVIPVSILVRQNQD